MAALLGKTKDLRRIPEPAEEKRRKVDCRGESICKKALNFSGVQKGKKNKQGGRLIGSRRGKK